MTTSTATVYLNGRKIHSFPAERYEAVLAYVRTSRWKYLANFILALLSVWNVIFGVMHFVLPHLIVPAALAALVAPEMITEALTSLHVGSLEQFPNYYLGIFISGLVIASISFLAWYLIVDLYVLSEGGDTNDKVQIITKGAQ